MRWLILLATLLMIVMLYGCGDTFTGNPGSEDQSTGMREFVNSPVDTAGDYPLGCTASHVITDTQSRIQFNVIDPLDVTHFSNGFRIERASGAVTITLTFGVPSGSELIAVVADLRPDKPWQTASRGSQTVALPSGEVDRRVPSELYILDDDLLVYVATESPLDSWMACLIESITFP